MTDWPPAKETLLSLVQNEFLQKHNYWEGGAKDRFEWDWG